MNNLAVLQAAAEAWGGEKERGITMSRQIVNVVAPETCRREAATASACGRLSVRGFMLPALLLLSAFTLLPGGARAQSALTDDAHVSLSSGNANHGSKPNLNISSSENVYFKFKLSPTLPASTPGSEVARATLKLYVGNVATPGKLDVYAVSGAWDENSITQNSAPPLGGLVATTAQIGTDKQGKFVVIDVSPLIRQWLGDDGHGTNGLPNHGLAIVAHPADATTQEVASIAFDSKENSQTSHEAQLNIELKRAADGLQKVEHDASLAGDGTSASPLGVAASGIGSVHLTNNAVTGDKIADGAVTSAKVTAPLFLASADPTFTLLAVNTGGGAAIMAAGAINTTTHYNISGHRVLSIAGFNSLLAGIGAGAVNTGINNSFFGNNAGQANTTGQSNSFFGQDAGASNTTALFNSFFGVSAGRSTTTGNNNSFFGYHAGINNTTGFTNSFYGINAGRDNTTGIANSFFGGIAGRDNTTGVSNTFLGVQAGFTNTTGDDNVFIGASAAGGNTIGNENVIIGAFADVGANNLTNATAIGNRALVSQSNSLVLGSISGANFAAADTNVGIGTTAPKTKLHLAGGKVYVEANGQGVILKSPGGACFELTVTDAGALTTAAVACP